MFVLKDREFYQLELNMEMKMSEIRKRFGNGLTLKGALDQQKLYGMNDIKIEVPSWIEMLSSEILHPIYLWQIMAIYYWYYCSYTIYAIWVTIMLVLTTLQDLWSARKRH